jgi:membrane protease YdiL (CAAX protease family)
VAWAHSWDIWLIFLVLGVIVPWRGRVRLRELLSRPQVSSQDRVSLYFSTILFQWVAAGVAGWRAWAHGFSLKDLAIVSPTAGIVAASLAGAAAIGAFQWFSLRRVGASRARGEAVRGLARTILPQSRPELVRFLGLAMTAGICEEFLYRGFAMAVFLRAGLPTSVAVLLSSVLFGLAHLYQGRGGLLATMILGLAFGMLRVASASLIPVVFCHTAVDVVAGIAGPRFLVGLDSRNSNVNGSQSISY